MPSRNPVASEQARLLYEDAEIRVVHRPAASEFSLVTFAGMRHQHVGLSFWGDHVAVKLGIDAVGIVAKRENWYPATAMAGAAAALRSVLKPQAIGYGFSMGGYGALKHGRLLGLTHVLAVSPQISVDPADVPQETRYHPYFDPALHQGMCVAAADLAPFALIVADSHDPIDSVHARAIAALGPVQQVAVPFMGHGTIWLFAKTETLHRTLEFVLARDTAGLRRFVRERRRDSAEWFRFVGFTALGRGRTRIAERLWARAVALGTPIPALQWDTALAMEALLPEAAARGQAGPAVTLALEQAAMRLAGYPDGLMRVGRALVKIGQAEEGIALLRQALALEPGQLPAHRILCHALVQQGREMEAIAAHRAALEHAPGEPHLSFGLGHLLIRCGDPAAAVEMLRQTLASPQADRDMRGRALLLQSHALAQLRRLPDALEAARAAAAALPATAQAADWLRRVEVLSGLRATEPD